MSSVLVAKQTSRRIDPILSPENLGVRLYKVMRPGRSGPDCLALVSRTKKREREREEAWGRYDRKEMDIRGHWISKSRGVPILVSDFPRVQQLYSILKSCKISMSLFINPCILRPAQVSSFFFQISGHRVRQFYPSWGMEEVQKRGCHVDAEEGKVTGTGQVKEDLLGGPPASTNTIAVGT